MAKTPKRNARVELLNTTPSVSKARLEAIRRWHIDQAMSERNPVALIAITLTDDDLVITNTVGFEPEFAQSLLPAIYKLAERIEATILESKPPLHLVRQA